MRFSTKRMVSIGLFAALIAIFSQIYIPLPFTPVPVNLALLAVILCGAILGAYDSTICLLVYILIGTAGVPVFAKFGAGLAALTGPTGGYIIGYMLTALITSLLSKRVFLPIAMALGIAACYALGTAWFIFSTGTSVVPALMSCVIPFIPGDILKISTAYLITKRFQKLELSK